ncbi:hypothetical protein [Actinomadura harenae]|uniref:hypothetical protein n=1 Tax=Actinomadura harenae TaxID=2483351 RepID=UPI0011C3FCFA|nr:hypothetical protein [Actinomadura harenae]
MDLLEHLIDAKARFLEAEARLTALAATLPRAIDIANGEAELSPEQRAAWDEPTKEQQHLAAEIQTDPWWADVDQAEGRLELTRQARVRAEQQFADREKVK